MRVMMHPLLLSNAFACCSHMYALSHVLRYSLISLATNLQAGARYAEGLLKALGVQQAIAVGHSAGALTAMELFKRCVQRVSVFPLILLAKLFCRLQMVSCFKHC